MYFELAIDFRQHIATAYEMTHSSQPFIPSTHRECRLQWTGRNRLFLCPVDNASNYFPGCPHDDLIGGFGLTGEETMGHQWFDLEVTGA